MHVTSIIYILLAFCFLERMMYFVVKARPLVTCVNLLITHLHFPNQGFCLHAPGRGGRISDKKIKNNAASPGASRTSLNWGSPGGDWQYQSNFATKCRRGGLAGRLLLAHLFDKHHIVFSWKWMDTSSSR